ncbi:MAG: hypothetical protein HKP14_00575 [Bacteroidia bacterium]|nr:hypothetical protein [Bacteroidia bacterium]
MRISILISAIILIGGSACNKTSPLQQNVLIYGHGGTGFDVLNSAYAPNTIPSCELALSLYDLDGVEIDLQYTKEGDLVLFHDDFLEKSTQCKGRINDLSLDSICQCIYRKQYTNSYKHNVLSFDSFLNHYVRHWPQKRISLNIQGSFNIPYTIDTLASRFVRKLKEYNIGEYASIECGSTYFLKKIKEYDSTRLCYAVGGQNESFVNEIITLNLDGIVCRFSETDNDLQKMLVDSGKHITLYDLKIKRDYKETNWNGVHSMQTDNPVVSLKYFGRD